MDFKDLSARELLDLIKAGKVLEEAIATSNIAMLEEVIEKAKDELHRRIGKVD
jgi:hypothetical protein